MEWTACVLRYVPDLTGTRGNQGHRVEGQSMFAAWTARYVPFVDAGEGRLNSIIPSAASCSPHLIEPRHQRDDMPARSDKVDHLFERGERF